jgi:hypothetical protein
VRLAGSTGANPYAAISAGVAALWGPAHGGANEAVLAMLEQIGTVENIPKYLAMVKDKSSHFRLMGFGHRVYKNFDPRAKIIREMCHKVLAKLGRKDNPLFELALRLEDIALKDEYFVSRKLYPNVDFYSGIIYSALGIPRSMFTVMFAIARTVGWVAHWLEMIADPNMRISRPRQLYTGPVPRDYVSTVHALALWRSLPAGQRIWRSSSASAPRRRHAASVCRPPGSPAPGGCHRAGTRWPRSAVVDREAHPGIGLDALGIQAHAPLGDFVRDAAVHQLSVTFSGRSANRCSWISACAVAVPLSTGPTRRGSNCDSWCIACSAARRCSCRLCSCPLASNSRWYSASASSISVLRGSAAPSATPEPLGRLALGGQEVMNAVLRHDARGFLRERAAQVAVAG